MVAFDSARGLPSSFWQKRWWAAGKTPGGRKYEGKMPYAETFGSVAKNKPLLYLNSLMQVAFALNMGNFSETYHTYSGGDWTVVISKLR